MMEHQPKEGFKEAFREAENHPWIESKRAGHDVGWPWAKEDWLDKYFEKWRQRQSGSWWN